MDLSGLEALVSVETAVFDENEQLTSLNGLGAAELGSLTITENRLSSIEALSHVTTISGDLYISDLQLASLHGLEGLTEVGGVFTLYALRALPDLSELSQLSTVGELFVFGLKNSSAGLDSLSTVSGDMAVIGNSFTDLSGFSALASVGGSLTLRENKITSLDGTGSLHTIGQSLYIEHNSKLFDLGGMQADVSVGQHLYLYSNVCLEAAEAEAFASTLVVNGDSIVGANDGPC